MKINAIQADIIFKALHYVCYHEKIEVPIELKKVFVVLSEENPNDTHATDVLHVMASLHSFIRKTSL